VHVDNFRDISTKTYAKQNTLTNYVVEGLRHICIDSMFVLDTTTVGMDSPKTPQDCEEGEENSKLLRLSTDAEISVDVSNGE